MWPIVHVGEKVGGMAKGVGKAEIPVSPATKESGFREST